MRRLEAESRTYATRLNAFLVVAVAGWLLFAAQYAIQGNRLTVTLDIAVAGLTALARSWMLRQTELRCLRIATHFAAGVSAIGLAVAATLSGGTDSIAVWYLVVLPVYIAYQEGISSAIVWSAIAVVLMLAVYAVGAWTTVVPEFVPTPFEVLLGQVVLVGIIFMFSAAARRANEQHVLAIREREQELKLSRDAYSLANERLSTLVENVSMGVLLTDMNDHVVLVNDTLRSMLGIVVPRSELVGLSFQDFCSRYVNPATADVGICAAGLDLSPDRESRELRMFDGRVLEGERVRIGDRGQVEGFVACFRDITQRKEVERLKDEFVATVSHELRTPLTAIRGSLGLIAGGTTGEVPQRSMELIRIADTNAERLVRLISDVLDLQKIEAGGLSLRPQAIRAAQLIGSVIDAFESAALQKQIALTCATGAVDLTFAGDADRLTQVLTNLVANAIKFTEQGGSVEVDACKPSSGGVRFSVADDGAGIAPEDAEQLFRRFHQIDGSDSRRKSGSGLGLAICKAIVEQHGGRIGVESALGKGSTFWFEIPDPGSIAVAS